MGQQWFGRCTFSNDEINRIAENLINSCNYKKDVQTSLYILPENKHLVSQCPYFYNDTTKSEMKDLRRMAQQQCRSNKYHIQDRFALKEYRKLNHKIVPIIEENKVVSPKGLQQHDEDVWVREIQNLVDKIKILIRQACTKHVNWALTESRDPEKQPISSAPFERICFATYGMILAYLSQSLTFHPEMNPPYIQIKHRTYSDHIKDTDAFYVRYLSNRESLRKFYLVLLRLYEDLEAEIQDWKNKSKQ